MQMCGCWANGGWKSFDFLVSCFHLVLQLHSYLKRNGVSQAMGSDSYGTKSTVINLPKDRGRCRWTTVDELSEEARTHSVWGPNLLIVRDHLPSVPPNEQAVATIPTYWITYHIFFWLKPHWHHLLNPDIHSRWFLDLILIEATPAPDW